MTIRIKHQDKKNALSILQAAEREMKYTLSLKVTEESAFSIIRNIYECFRMLGDASLVSKGFSSQDHIEPINELLKIPVVTKRPIILIEMLRKLRHNINYYGYTPSKIEAEDAISIAETCFYPLLDFIRNNITKDGP